MADLVIRDATTEKMNKFDMMRGKYSSEVFWDVVVLSALDCDQKDAFEMQIKGKIERKELPLSPTYHIMHDPIGVKVGNGGAVISIIDELDQIYGEKLESLKVVVFLSGGYSQRLPSASALGKIFTALPFGDPIYQMLEAKLAMFIDFPKRMNAGIFVASSDCFELYNLHGDEWTFVRPGVTALAHSSPIDVGLTHGVFVLDGLTQNKESNSRTNTTTKMADCKQFLHKPTKELMRNHGAVFLNDKKEYIYSDSAYFMDIKTAKLLLNWYKLHGPITCEIDAYGDFLQSLGPAATADYCKDVKNVTVVLDELEKTRLEIFDVLKNTPLNVLLLDNSKFYHIGTTKEYIYHFCIDNVFREELSCLNHVMLKTDKLHGENSKQQVFIHSYIPDLSCIGENVIIEYSLLNVANAIGENCIISNCSFPEGISVPANTFLHTIPVSDFGSIYYVTLCFNINDDLKASVIDKEETSSLKIFGKPLSELVSLLQLTGSLWPKNCPVQNIWNAKLFPAYSSPTQSLQAAVDIENALFGHKSPVFNYDGSFYSIADVLKLKNLNYMLNFRAKLRDFIES